MRKTNRLFIPSIILIVIQIAMYVFYDKRLLDHLAIAEENEFRNQYGSISTFFMCASLFAIFCCVTILFEKSIFRYILMLFVAGIYTAFGIKMNQIIYIIPLVIGILAFITYLLACRYVKLNHFKVSKLVKE